MMKMNNNCGFKSINETKNPVARSVSRVLLVTINKNATIPIKWSVVIWPIPRTYKVGIKEKDTKYATNSYFLGPL
jgi:hypothetical protein